MISSVRMTVGPPPEKQRASSIDPPSHGSGEPTRPEGKENSATDPFVLEETFTSTADVFSSNELPSIRDGDVIVVLDTNTLLLPYSIKPDDLGALETVYRALADADRLCIPARVAREFIKNRDRLLADLLKALNDQKSRIQLPHERLSPLLEGVPGYQELIDSRKTLADVRSSYNQKLDTVIERLRSWRGDDPVTVLYQAVFSKGNIVELDAPRKELIAEWSRRRRDNIPPGYKDSAKEDTGIGDFLIWKTILQIGSQRKRGIAFVTGDEKADWFVRSGGEGIYPRPELVSEFRRSAGNVGLTLISLSNFLAEMKAGREFVDEVRSAEAETSRERDTSDEETAVSFKPSSLRRVLREVFPGRRRSPASTIQEFYREVRLAGVQSDVAAREILLKYRNAALASEKRIRGDDPFFDVGIGREAFECADPAFRELVALDDDEKIALLGD